MFCRNNTLIKDENPHQSALWRHIEAGQNLWIYSTDKYVAEEIIAPGFFNKWRSKLNEGDVIGFIFTDPDGKGWQGAVRVQGDGSDLIVGDL